MCVALPIVVGAWSMTILLRQLFEYYYYYLFYANKGLLILDRATNSQSLPISKACGVEFRGEPQVINPGQLFSCHFPLPYENNDD